VTRDIPQTGRRKALLLVLVLPFALAGCRETRFPRDPDATLESVLATGSLTVAITDHAPWAEMDDGGRAEGAEVDLVEAFAAALGVRVVWTPLGAFAALDALESGEADLAVGGFTRDEVTSHGAAAPTYAYFDERLVVAAPPDHGLQEDLEGARVYVPPGVVATRLVREQGGTPVAEPSAAGLVALPRWRLAGTGLVPTGILLERRPHVLAVPKGENAWLLRLEQFLRLQGPVDVLLRENAG
jgi:polar amino acid transport system substrate-binding protein